MKRVLSLVLVAGVAFSLGHFLRAPIPIAGAAGGDAMPVSGDVNGDGMLNIADPVYLCRFLFSDGPALVPIVCPPTGLPATGQTKCYDGSLPANEVDCASAEYPGQDAFYQAGCPSEGRCIDHGDGTLTDTCTGLMWQKNTADFNGNGKVDENTTDQAPWTAALLYCDGLSFAGHDDWRLPNLLELQSIVDYSRHDPAIGPVFVAVSSNYWSSSSYLGYASPEYAWIVGFNDGDLGNASKWGYHYIRAVRNAQ
jgi:hypothetical protein